MEIKFIKTPSKNHNEKKFLFVVCLLTASILFAQSQHVKYNFNTDWKVFVGNAKGGDAVSFSDASWKKVTLPYAWLDDGVARDDVKAKGKLSIIEAQIYEALK
jgi:hypothetical protein